MLGVSVAFAMLYLVLALAFGYCILKTRAADRRQMILISVDMLIGAVLLTVSGLTDNMRLFITGGVCPIALMLTIICSFSLYFNNKCTLEIRAKCIGFRIRGNSYIIDHYPRFQYYYEYEKYESDSMLKYGKREARSKYSVGSEYLIFIDPNDPQKCVCDKGRMTVNCIVGIVISGIVVIVGAAALFL